MAFSESGSKPEVTSSQHIASGSVASSTANPILLSCPPESDETSFSECSANPTIFNIFPSLRDFSDESEMEMSRADCRASLTVSIGWTHVNCGANPIFPTKSSLRSINLPSKKESPSEGMIFNIAFTSVVFPHPDGPITAFIACGINETLASFNIGSLELATFTVRFLQLNIFYNCLIYEFDCGFY